MDIGPLVQYRKIQQLDGALGAANRIHDRLLALLLVGGQLDDLADAEGYRGPPLEFVRVPLDHDYLAGHVTAQLRHLVGGLLHLDVPTRAGGHSEHLGPLIRWGLVPEEGEHLGSEEGRGVVKGKVRSNSMGKKMARLQAHNRLKFCHTLPVQEGRFSPPPIWGRIFSL